MYDKIGEKIKMLAKVGFIVLATLTLVCGVAIIGNSGNISIGFLVLFGGPLISWVSSLLIYGFGELIENTGKIVANTSKCSTESKEKSTKEDEEKVDQSSNQELTAQ